jgi:alpha-glucosidase
VATRWGGPQAPALVAKLVLAMQLSLKGTPCLYQGDELALPEADVPFELLQDPYGITFWPEFKGRDGCRTPMPWTSDGAERRLHHRQAVAAGAAGAPGPGEASVQDKRPAVDAELPAQDHPLAPQAAAADARRHRQFFDAPEPVLALRRDLAGERRCWPCSTWATRR